MRHPAVSIVIPSYLGERWANLQACLNCALSQTFEDVEVIVAVDHNEALARRVALEFPNVKIASNAGLRGASATRNAGAAAARGDVLAFLDDDCVAEPTWLKHLCTHLARPDVLGVGGRTLVRWPARKPRWFPDEFAWVVGGSYRGLPTEPASVRGVWSGNMVVERGRFVDAGGFHAGFGKVGSRSRPEDTEFSIRLSRLHPDRAWFYEPKARVEHVVPVHRTTPTFFLARCWAEGSGKAALREGFGREATSAEGAYIRVVLPAGIGREVANFARSGDVGGLVRALAIIGGLSSAAGGMVVGRVVGRLGPEVG
jgi:glycosyltransferase involved in cell wall biosynthesis